MRVRLDIVPVALALAMSFAARADEDGGVGTADGESSDRPAGDSAGDPTGEAPPPGAPAPDLLSFVDTFDSLVARGAIAATDVLAVMPPKAGGRLPVLADHAALFEGVAAALEAVPAERRPSLLPLERLGRPLERYDRDYLSALAAHERVTLALFVDFVETDGRTMRRSRLVETEAPGVRDVEWRVVTDTERTVVRTPTPAPASVEVELRQCTATGERVVCDLVLSRESDESDAPLSLDGIAFASPEGVFGEASITVAGSGGMHADTPVVTPRGTTFLSASLDVRPDGDEPLEALLLEFLGAPDVAPRRVPVPAMLQLR